MKIINRLTNWLETHWVTPAYAGWLLGFIAICFFGAATNTMAGWLYVISGIIFALLGLAAFLPARSLKQIKVHRQPISAVSVGDELTIEIEIENQTNKPKALLQVRDILQAELGKPIQTAVEIIEPQSTYHWVYYHPTHKRGIFRWQEVQLRTGTPLGLFWCSRSWEAIAKAIVYPTVLPLNSCPLVDELGQEDSLEISSNRRSRSATEDLTKALRPYRVGDPTRLIHWRTSARYDQLMVRELEVFTGSQEIIICLDSSTSWHSEDFEAAVVAASSLYFYAHKRQLPVKIWTPKTGLVYGSQKVLEVLAAIHANEEARTGSPPYLPLIWLTQNGISLNSLPPGSRWLLWSSDLGNHYSAALQRDCPGSLINKEESLQSQLQQALLHN
ncbi:MAG: DUF58 domain-containing protein [Coleofasciculaceae cyanobacterium]